MTRRSESGIKEKATSERAYFSIPEAASIMGMSRIAVYKKVKKGEIGAIRIGRTYGIPRLYLDEIGGKVLSAGKKKLIDRAVGRVVEEYGELLLKLGNG